MRAQEAFEKVLAMKPETLLDIGSGDGCHAAGFRLAGMEVTTVNLNAPADIVGDFMQIPIFRRYDCVWASHVLEHQVNPGAFLSRCFECLKNDGILAITVPPAKHEIVGGHVTLWNAGLLLYNLILAGFDCATARVKAYDYNISVIVEKVKAELPRLKHDYGDIESLARFFPFPAVHGFNGDIQEINW